MEAKELMIGDWVECDTLYPHQVLITMQDLLWISQGKVANPIPLTPEILEKNGFELSSELSLHDEYIMRTGNRCYAKVTFYDSTENLVEISYMKDFEYTNTIHLCDVAVHELQRALRLCGLNELADNFKVLKEE